MTSSGSLILAPTSPRGWFGGRSLEARERIEVGAGLGLRDAADALDATFSGYGPPLTAALVTYEGEATVATYAAIGSPPPPSKGAFEGPLLRQARGCEGAAYKAGVEAVRERVAAGDVYVLNLTYTLTGRAALPGRESFAVLLARAGSDMSAYFETPAAALASVSPERFLRVHADAHGRSVEVCPIKGTRPRGESIAEDAAYAAELLADPKERAEHVMVVDLERNDLGRVCAPGSVAVDPLYEAIPTPYCHQLVSSVKGRMRPAASLADLLEATFPCGSVTGAPKVAAMRIAAELEAAPRGPYCGALLVAVPGEIDSSVLIRTLVVRPDGSASWGTGCGITHESDADAEWAETLLKAWPVLGDDMQ